MSATAHATRHFHVIPLGRATALLLGVAVAFGFCGHVAAQESIIATFEAVAPPDNPPAEAGEQPRGENATAQVPTLSFSFRFAPWEDVLTKFADVAGLTLDLTDIPNGTFNYYDKGRYSPREALDILNGYLLQRGFVLVRRDRFLVCVNLEKGIPANLIPVVTADQLADFGNNELVSVIFAHEDMDANLAASQVEQLQGAQGKVVSLNATNSLLVTDTGGNLRLIQRLLDGGAFKRRANGVTGSSFQSFALQHVRAEEAERLIRTMFGVPSTTASSGATEVASASPTSLAITSDARTNRLFVSASGEKLASIEQIVTAYDVADASATASPRGATTTRILPLPGADLIIIGRALESLSPRIRVSTTRAARDSAATESPPERPSPDKPAGKPANGANPPAATLPGAEGRDR